MSGTIGGDGRMLNSDVNVPLTKTRDSIKVARSDHLGPVCRSTAPARANSAATRAGGRARPTAHRQAAWPKQKKPKLNICSTPSTAPPLEWGSQPGGDRAGRRLVGTAHRQTLSVRRRFRRGTSKNCEQSRKKRPPYRFTCGAHGPHLG